MKLLNVLVLASLFNFANADLIRVSDNVIKDTKTNFLWQDSKEAKTQRRSFEEAKAYCQNLELDGKTKWEMPSFLAAFSIVNTKVYNPTLSKEFKNYVSDNYWTTKTFSHAMSKEAFVVDYKSGAFNRKLMEDKFYVRCFEDLNK
ncbi:DUF1566 domain-containing protein [Poseidonibacter lekithochrous]|uniref:Lcl domain-containing protein n=1 Tax=Poseidonibacter lekithochrous TaxID=1904463 RepID=UPI0008FC6E98|nr:DUF1566 domain-containing protein [Poseidonibacter lekithochrous]QKJ22456.1 DUF1566 domain-containing protein [Poseidonibacter lekithochrous]